jgi:hypothetical protein
MDMSTRRASRLFATTNGRLVGNWLSERLFPLLPCIPEAWNACVPSPGEEMITVLAGWWVLVLVLARLRSGSDGNG